MELMVGLWGVIILNARLFVDRGGRLNAEIAVFRESDNKPFKLIRAGPFGHELFLCWPVIAHDQRGHSCHTRSCLHQ